MMEPCKVVERRADGAILCYSVCKKVLNRAQATGLILPPGLAGVPA